MRVLLSALVITLGLSLAVTVPPDAPVVPQHLQKNLDASVTVKTGLEEGSYGAGTLFRTKAGFSYVVTAAHVVSHVRHKTDEGTTFGDLYVERCPLVNGEKQPFVRTKASVVRYSGYRKEGCDVAVLLVLDNAEFQASAHIDHSESPLIIGTPIYHIGTPENPWHLSHTVVHSHIANLGLRAFGITSRDAFDAAVFGGCSGGGVFLQENGNYMGMLTNGLGNNFGFYVPLRVIIDFAKKAGFEGLFDPNGPEPMLFGGRIDWSEPAN